MSNDQSPFKYRIGDHVVATNREGQDRHAHAGYVRFRWLDAEGVVCYTIYVSSDTMLRGQYLHYKEENLAPGTSTLVTQNHRGPDDGVAVAPPEGCGRWGDHVLGFYAYESIGVAVANIAGLENASFE